MKKSKKILSLGLATAMAFSVGASAFAASAAENEPAYTPTYNDRVTEEKVGELITMADGAIEDLVWASYGQTILESLLGVFPSLGGDFATAAFYQQIDAELFADLADPVTAESLTAYLAEHPITAASSEEVLANLEKILPAAIEGLMYIEISDGLPLANLIGMVAALLADAVSGIDEVAAVLGADVGEKALFNILVEIGNGSQGENADAVIEQGAQDLTNYVMGIVRLLAPNTVDKLLTLLNTYSDNQAAVLTAVNHLVSGLESGLTDASGLLGMFAPDLVPTINQILGVVTWLNAQIAAHTVTTDVQAVDAEGNPVVDEEGNPVYEQVLDLDSALSEVLNGATGAFGGLVDIPDLSAVVGLGEDSTAMIKLSSVNDMINSIAAEGCDSSADVLMVAYNYLYDNIFGNDQNYTTIKNALPLIANFLPNLGLDEATVQMITDMIPTITSLLDQLKAAGPLGTMDTLMVMLGILEDPNAVTPTDPTQPGTEGGDNTNPGTGDAALGAVVMMGTAAAAAIVLLRRKK